MKPQESSRRALTSHINVHSKTDVQANAVYSLVGYCT